MTANGSQLTVKNGTGIAPIKEKGEEKMIDKTKIKRRGNYIWIAKGITAIEGTDGGLRTMKIRKNGKVVRSYRGSSLDFGINHLSEEDQDYLASLVG